MGQEVAKPNAVALTAALESVGGVIDNGLFLPPDLPFERYESIGAMLGELHKSAAFLIGDWLNYGEHVYGEKYAQAALVLGLSEQTCANYASVANRVPPSRRRYGVSFTKHQEVASLAPNDQRHWLKVAADEGLTRAELRERLRPLKGLPPAGRTITCPHCGKAFSN
jgi:hypothetical protein